MAFDFSFLPKPEDFGLDDLIFLVDTSVFNLRGQEVKNPVNTWSNYSIREFVKEGFRIRDLRMKLESMPNWTTVPEVLGEYIRGTVRLARMVDEEPNPPRNIAIRHLITQRTAMETALRNPCVLTTRENVESEAAAMIERIKPGIRMDFLSYGGNLDPHELADVALLATALVFCSQLPVAMYSRDRAILDTFKYRVENPLFPMQPAFIVDEKRRVTLPVSRYVYFRREMPIMSRV